MQEVCVRFGGRAGLGLGDEQRGAQLGAAVAMQQCWCQACPDSDAQHAAADTHCAPKQCACPPTRAPSLLPGRYQVELLGANVSANASREQMSYNIDCLRSGVPQALELLADAVLQPAFAEEEVEEQKGRMEALLASPELQVTLMTEVSVQCGGGVERWVREGSIARSSAGAAAATPAVAATANTAQPSKAHPHSHPTTPLQALLRAAYTGGLANPLIPDPSALHHLSPQVLSAFVAKHYTPHRMVLAGAGVEHEQLVELARPLLEALPAGPQVAEPGSSYVGGGLLLPGDLPQANLILAFEYQGGWQDIEVGGCCGALFAVEQRCGGCRQQHGCSQGSCHCLRACRCVLGLGLEWRRLCCRAVLPPHKAPHPFLPSAALLSSLPPTPSVAHPCEQGSVVMTVLTFLMGGGASFSSGGPGKGMHSRLYTRVLNQYHWVHSCTAFSQTFNNTGLLGIQVSWHTYW